VSLVLGIAFRQSERIKRKRIQTFTMGIGELRPAFDAADVDVDVV